MPGQPEPSVFHLSVRRRPRSDVSGNDKTQLLLLLLWVSHSRSHHKKWPTPAGNTPSPHHKPNPPPCDSSDQTSTCYIYKVLRSAGDIRRPLRLLIERKGKQKHYVKRTEVHD